MKVAGSLMMVVGAVGWLAAVAFWLVPAHFYLIESNPSCGVPATHVSARGYPSLRQLPGRMNFAPMGPSIDGFLDECTRRSRQHVEAGVVAGLVGTGGLLAYRSIVLRRVTR